jgi:hypothetical protein
MKEGEISPFLRYIMKKLLSFDEFINESKVNEGAVKQFEIAMKNLINNIRAGYGWIDPEYVYDTVVTDGEFDEFNWNDIKDEVYQRLIDQNLLYYANDADPEVKGQKVSNIKAIKESVNEGSFYRFPRKTIENELWSVAKSVQNFFNRASAGVDCKPEELDSIIKNLEKIRKQAKKFSSREEVSGTVYESEEVNEAADEFVVATLSEDFEDLKKGQTVKIKAIEFTQGGDKETIESIRPDGKKMEIKKAIIEVKI